MSAVLALTPAHTRNHSAALSPKIIAHYDLRSLFTGIASGHLGSYGYLGKGGQYLEAFYKGHKSYYPHDRDIEFLSENAEQVGSKIRNTERLVIVGPGPVPKETVLVPYLPNLRKVLLMDVSEPFCNHSREQLMHRFNEEGRSGIVVETKVGDYLSTAPQVRPEPNTTVISTGSLLSNVPKKPHEDFPDDQILIGLSRLGEMASRSGGHVVLTYDSCQDPHRIWDSYNSPHIDAFMLHCVAQAFEMAGDTIKYDRRMKPITTENISDYFYRRTETGVGIIPTHYVHCNKPIGFKFNDLGQGAVAVNLKEGDAFCPMYSVKPMPHQMTDLARKAGQSTDIVLTSGDSLSIHVMSPR